MTSGFGLGAAPAPTGGALTVPGSRGPAPEIIRKTAAPAWQFTPSGDTIVSQIVRQLARNTQEFLATRKADELGARVVAVRNEGRWQGVSECGGYMGAAVYDIPCTPDSYAQKIWMADIYNDALPWLGKGIQSSPTSASDRVSWFVQMAKFISASQSSSGMKPVFMHVRQSELGLAARTRTSLTRGVLPAARGTRLASKVMLYGPKGARRIAGDLWKKARTQGRRLFLPVDHSRFFVGATGYPGQPRGTLLTASGYDAGSEAIVDREYTGGSTFEVSRGEPWDLMEKGQYAREGSTIVRDGRRMTVRGAASRSFDAIGDIRVVHNSEWHGGRWDMFDFGLSRAAVFNAIAARNDPGEMVPLETLFPSTRGQGADSFMVPTWSTLKKYISEWAKPLIQPEGIFIKQGWSRYVTYFESFPSESLGMTAPEHLAAIRSMNAAKQADAAGWVSLVGGTIAGVVTAINPIAGVIVAAVVAIVALLTSAFEPDVICPPIPMPFMTRSGPTGSVCDFGVVGSSPFQAVVNVVLEAKTMGYVLRMPKNVPEEYLGPLPSGEVIEDGRRASSSNIPLIVGGAVAALAIVAIAMGKR